jgi:predicted metal-dependent hydrolase
MRGGMGAKKKAAKAGAAAGAVTRSPYVRRLAEDEELRQNLWSAYESARKAVGRLQNGKSPTKQIFDDKRLQKDIKSAAESFKDASVALHEAPRRKRKRVGLGKLILIAVIGSAIALAVSEDLRKKLLDALFGAEEEFEYTSTTAPATPTPPPSASETAESTT